MREKAEERRKAIATLLMSTKGAIAGATLAQRFSVSRQIIVQDISLLKAAGYEILSTHYGYVMQKSPLCQRIFKVRHSTEQTMDELSAIVEQGGTIVDVYVWHRVYGKLEAPLGIYSQAQVKQFIEGVRSGKSSELMNITGGYHYHTVRAESEEILDNIAAILKERGYLVPEL